MLKIHNTAHLGGKELLQFYHLCLEMVFHLTWSHFLSLKDFGIYGKKCFLPMPLMVFLFLSLACSLWTFPMEHHSSGFLFLWRRHFPYWAIMVFLLVNHSFVDYAKWTCLVSRFPGVTFFNLLFDWLCFETRPQRTVRMTSNSSSSSNWLKMTILLLWTRCLQK